MIDQLDGRRAQVLVESLIVKCPPTNWRNLACNGKPLQARRTWAWWARWAAISPTPTAAATSPGHHDRLAQAGTTTGNTAAAKALSGVGQGFNVALAPRINGQYYLGALANFCSKAAMPTCSPPPT